MQQFISAITVNFLELTQTEMIEKLEKFGAKSLKSKDVSYTAVCTL
jgi:hypothetical protein